MASHRPILGSFEDIGENVGQQLKQLPGDMLGKALESVGVSTGAGTQKTPQGTAPSPSDAGGDANSSWNQIDAASSTQEKKILARKALEALLQPSSNQKEPSIWEKLMKEEEEKKQAKDKEKQQQMNELPMPQGKRKASFGMAAKKAGSEIGKNVKHD